MQELATADLLSMDGGLGLLDAAVESVVESPADVGISSPQSEEATSKNVSGAALLGLGLSGLTSRHRNRRRRMDEK